MAIPVTDRSPESLVREDVRALQAYHVPPAVGLIKLDAMENPYRLPEALAREMGARLAAVAVNRYPDPSGAPLKQALREAMAIPDAQEIVLGNGSDEILQIIAIALARPGAVALSVEPSFAMYRISAIAAGLRPVGVALRPDFSLDEPAVMRALESEKPALTWIAYPNNPTGNLFPREAVLRIVDRAFGTFIRGQLTVSLAVGLLTYAGLAALAYLGLPVSYTLCFVLGWGVWGLWIGLSLGLIVTGVILLYVWTVKISEYEASALLAQSLTSRAL